MYVCLYSKVSKDPEHILNAVSVYSLQSHTFFFSFSFCDRTLQEQNMGLHQNLLKTAVRMECLGEEFMSSQKVLEAELQRTRLELSNLAERFRR